MYRVSRLGAKPNRMFFYGERLAFISDITSLYNTQVAEIHKIILFREENLRAVLLA